MRKCIPVLMSLCLLALAVSGALADGQKSAVKAMPVGKVTEHKMEGKPVDIMAKPAGHMMIANEVAVCACGKVFHPDANTKFITFEGKRYALCSDDCLKKGEVDPASVARAAENNAKKLTSNPAPPKS